jgi:ABC-2 type transport system permease protein
LQFFMSCTMALLAFWLLEVSTLIFMVFAVEYIAGGHLFPLNILPPGVERVLNYTPFPYQLFFPVSIYLGQVKGAALWQGLLIETGWVAFFYALCLFVWRRGLQKYSAVGG